ncbi:uncharacterized protein LOC121389000 [Gigantopelta aegis]|uniref:uncharacterized protein LOC121389000 n=1 Tax=Gigantopelta aegis TaxID=1735272 RepID=UPI001B888E26|nr:uncharacterized protein LOC121389000 [Gigantopelta aegis]
MDRTTTLLLPAYVFFVLYLTTSVRGKSTQSYFIPGKDCNEFYTHLDGALVVGKGLAGYTGVCDITLSTGGDLLWMLYAKDMSLFNCQVSLTIFTVNVNGDRKLRTLEFMCASASPGVVPLNSSIVTVRLHHHNQTNYHFRLIFTARRPKYSCEDFRCDNGYCVSRDVLCDGVDNCFDGSDESVNRSTYCGVYDPFPGENFAVLISVVGGSIVSLMVVACCKMCRQSQQDAQRHEMFEYAHASKYGFLRTPSIRQPAKANEHKQSHQHHHRTYEDVDTEPEF